jgi:hypothetical protein
LKRIRYEKPTIRSQVSPKRKMLDIKLQCHPTPVELSMKKVSIVIVYRYVTSHFKIGAVPTALQDG